MMGKGERGRVYNRPVSVVTGRETYYNKVESALDMHFFNMFLSS